jgi:hypothetical protein
MFGFPSERITLYKKSVCELLQCLVLRINLSSKHGRVNKHSFVVTKDPSRHTVYI